MSQNSSPPTSGFRVPRSDFVLPCLLRWGVLVEWLGSYGVSEYQVRQMKAEGVIEEMHPPGLEALGPVGKRKAPVTRRAYYSRDQVQRDVLAKFNTGEQKG